MFVKDVNMLLNTRDVPNMFTQDLSTEIVRVKENLHIVLAMICITISLIGNYEL